MAIQKQGSKVVAKLTDLTQESVLNDGDRLVFWCNSSGEAATIDYSSLKIDLDHTTFGDTFTQVVNFATTANSWITSMTDSFNELDNKMNTVIESNTKINNELLAIKMLIKMILGIATYKAEQGNFSEQQYVDSLPEDARTIYTDLKDEVLTASGEDNIDFTRQNLIYLASQ